MAASAGVYFTINHIAAVIIPALLGIVWVWSSTLVSLLEQGCPVLTSAVSEYSIQTSSR